MSSATRDEGSWIGWAAWLAVSWTWCIGMFLPVLLLRDHGPGGWLAFALPNVLGAGAMGWVLSRDGSRDLCRIHGGAMAAFTGVTLGFHVVFLGWMATVLPLAWMAAGALLGFSWWLVRGRGRFAAAWGFLVLTAAVGAMALWLPRPDGLAGDWPTGWRGSAGWLVPAMFLGFGTCPYLDRTFHRARRGLDDAGARLAFGAGFGLLFLGVLVVTWLYAADLASLLGMQPPTSSQGVMARWLAVYLTAQSLCTVRLHLREARGQGAASNLPLAAGLAASVAAAPLLAWAVLQVPAGGRAADWLWGGAEVPGMGELVYWIVLSAYGVFFPAWLLVAILPQRWVLGRHARPSPLQVSLAGASAVGAFPFLWIGFLAGGAGWLTLGVGVVACATAFSWWSRRAEAAWTTQSR